MKIEIQSNHNQTYSQFEDGYPNMTLIGGISQNIMIDDKGVGGLKMAAKV